MRLELIELLRTREIIHPSRIVRLESRCAADLRIEVVGYPWWLERGHPDEDHEITFHIEGIISGCVDSSAFDPNSNDEALDSFEVRRLSENEWADGEHCRVYCNGPLSSPIEIYIELHDFLRSINCPFGPGHYLNLGRSGLLKEFSAIASARSFLLCSGPKSVVQVVCDAIERRGAKFNVIGKYDTPSGLLCVELLDSYLICRSAYAVFEPPASARGS